jgi:hypothetical protein
MTEITRETLELAALAAGHEVACTEAEMHGCEDSSTVYTGLMLRGAQDPWRPHLDDGDSRRLQVALKITLVHFDGPPRWAADHDDDAEVNSCTHDGTPSDAARAAREAVVLCAAEVGRRMREGGL